MSESEDLKPDRVAELLRESDAQLVDVRTSEEHAAGRIEGDLHIELDQLPARAESIDRDRPVVFYCRTGTRSALATQAFRGVGYDAYNLDGGIEAWVERGLPIEGALTAH